MDLEHGDRKVSKLITSPRIAIGIAAIVICWVAAPFVVEAIVGTSNAPEGLAAASGQYGDRFGSINALFTGLAFFGVIVTALLQKEELELQRRELEDTRGILSAQAEQLERQSKAMEAQITATEESIERQINATRAFNVESRQDRISSCWAAVRCEIQSCAASAQGYFDDEIGAPAYRLPTIVYERVFPELMMAGQLADDDVHALYQYFMNVQALNRGIDLSDAARARPTEPGQDILTRAQLEAEFQAEATRARSKANLIRHDGAIYIAAMDVVNRLHVHRQTRIAGGL